MADAGMSVVRAKKHFKRKRPFAYNKTPIKLPKREDYLKQDGSYPSGHAAIGWVWALILAEIFPDKADSILKRGIEFGYSRMVCNVHWNSDVEAGRLIGTAVYSKLHANKNFLIDLKRVKEEVEILMK